MKNIVEVAKKTFPQNVNVSFSQDTSKYIKDMLNGRIKELTEENNERLDREKAERV